jgi:predicted nucleic acid-binding protein
VPFVLDASAALEAAFDDESGSVGRAVTERLAIDTAYVPPVWFAEISQATVQAVRRGRVSHEGGQATLAALVGCPIAVVPDHRETGAVVELALRAGLSAYDAAYLLLASDMALELATCDRRLREAAEHAGVACL